MDKESYRAYLKTPYWREVSRLVRKRYGWRCGVCNSPLEIQAHHRTYEHRGDELNHLDDLICLCKVCHKLFHGEQKKKARLAYTINRPRTKKPRMRKPRPKKG